jgi:hypothetical protein
MTKKPVARPEKVTVRTLREMKRKGEKIVALTAYDAPMARLLNRAAVDVILVGDSVGNVKLGFSNTLPVPPMLLPSPDRPPAPPDPVMVFLRSFHVSHADCSNPTALLMADTGVKATEFLLADLKRRVKESKTTDPVAVKGLLADAIADMLAIVSL